MLKRGNKGFTLIELITVMVILGVLAAYAVPKMFDFTGTAKTKTRGQFKVEINSALRMYGLKAMADAGTKSYPYPSALTLSDVITESSDLTYTASTTTSGTGAFVYAPAGDVAQYLSYISSGSAYTLGDWATSNPVAN